MVSEYEGKTYRRKRGNVDLIDLLYYGAAGEAMPHDIKESILKSMKEQGKDGGIEGENKQHAPK